MLSMTTVGSTPSLTTKPLLARYVSVVVVYLKPVVEAGVGDDFGGDIGDTAIFGVMNKYYGFCA